VPVYRNLRLPDRPQAADLRRAAQDYAAIAQRMMAAIVERSERVGGGLIDTKLDLITGRDFAADDPIRGQNAVYGWIQGRGLEALAGHGRWWEARGEAADLVPRMRDLAAALLARLRAMRARNGGRLSFFMTREGEPFHLDDAGQQKPFELTAAHPHGFSDLFAAKGMYAAARWLGDDEAAGEARAYIDAVDAAIVNDTFRSDQISLDPKNRPEPKAGYHPHGARMIQLGAWALRARSGETRAIEPGLIHVEYELARHAHLDGRIPHLCEGDFWEAVDDDGQPFVEADGVILSDPGHSLEFVGLARLFLDAATLRATPEQARRIGKAGARLVTLLARNFDNGYLPGPQGISKAFDLVTRRQLNTDMPWWNLPETIRAAALCLPHAATDEERQICLRVWRDSHNAFREFTRPDLHLMAYQTRDACGLPVAAIPATADADPGYHTGLSLLDAIDVAEALGPTPAGAA
jgi:hypothetical protein